MIGVYVAIYLWNDTGFVSIFVSLVLFLFIFLFTADLMDVYLDNRDEYYDDSVKLMPGLRQKQILAPNGYEQIANPVSQPESDRRLRSEWYVINYLPLPHYSDLLHIIQMTDRKLIIIIILSLLHSLVACWEIQRQQMWQ